jgi:DNA-binding MarR family transcriptional regulator
MKEASTNRDFELYKWLQRTSNLSFKIRGKELIGHGIAAMHAAVLDTVLEIGKKATPAEIARRLVREPHTISNLLNRMEKQGLIRKVNDLDKKNLVRVVLTQKGRDTYAKISKRDSLVSLMSNISDDEYNQLVEKLQKILTNAYNILGKRNPFERQKRR